jgi:GT2 family glycosyltransferase
MLTFIIPVRNNLAFTTQCLVSLDHTINSLGISAQIILIDNNSDPAEGIQPLFATFLKKHPSSLNVRFSKDCSYTGAFALGLQHAKKQNVIFVSNDMMITPSYVSSILAVSSFSDEYGIVRGTSAHTDSFPEHQIVPPLKLKSYDDIISFSKMVAEVNGLHHVEDKVVAGDSLLIKRQVIEKIGVLDTRFFGYFGDIDYGLRAHLAGFKLICAKGAWLHHEGAGYLKGEASANGLKDLSAPHRERMKRVQTAYQAFRDKWDLTLPEMYSDLTSLNLFEMAERNAHKVKLKCDLDPELIKFVDYVSPYSN